MTDSYQEIFHNAQAAITAGEKQRAIELLRQAAAQNDADPKPWLQMVYAAPSKPLALEYLAQAKQRKLNIFTYAQAMRWIENFYGELLLEEIPPNPGLLDRIHYQLEKYPYLVALVYLALIAQAEASTISRDPRIGMVLHGLSLVLLLVHASFFSNKRSQIFLLSLALTPLIRLLSLTLPLPTFPAIYWYAIVGAPIFLAAYLMARIARLKNKQIGLTVRSVPIQALIGLSGVGLGYLEYYILRPPPLVEEFNFNSILLPAIILLIFTGFLEELVFRGILQYGANKYIGRWGILYVAFIFAVFHLGYKSVLDFFFVLLVSLLFSYLVQKTGSIVGVTIAHGLTNIFLYLIFPFILLAPTNQAEAQSFLVSEEPVAQLVETETQEVQAQRIPEKTASESPLFTETTQNILLTPTGVFTAVASPSPTLTATIEHQSYIVDDGDPGFVHMGATWWKISQGVFDDLVWSYVSYGQPTARVEWQPELVDCGKYAVEAYIPMDFGTSPAVVYHIDHSEGSASVIVDQSAHQGEWVWLGDFWFNSTDPCEVWVDNSLEKFVGIRMVAYDAIKWEMVEVCYN